MTTMTINDTRYLSLKWTVSRGRDTYGYNICTLTDTETHERYRCNGGGYDMVGTVFAQWLQTYQSELQAIASDAHRRYDWRADGPETSTNEAGLYGMTAHYNNDGTLRSVTLDGACGLESMRRIAKAIGVDVRAVAVRGQTEGFLVGEPATP